MLRQAAFCGKERLAKDSTLYKINLLCYNNQIPKKREGYYEGSESTCCAEKRDH